MRSVGAKASRCRIVGNELRSGGNPWPPRALGRRFLWGFGLSRFPRIGIPTAHARKACWNCRGQFIRPYTPIDHFPEIT
jgi:hypothetical protein